MVVLAAATWATARAAAPVPLVAALAALAVALAWRRPWLVVAAMLALASARGAASDRAWRLVEAGPWRGPVTLVGDPQPLGAGWQADVRLGDGRRVSASAYGSIGYRLAPLVAGSEVAVVGRLRPIDDRPWARARHLEGRLDLDQLGPARPPDGLRAVVEGARALVVRGADPLPADLRSLYLGLVIGDDRNQSPAEQAQFRAAGLSHLLAVSGQNVAFLLAVARPVIGLAGRRTRFVLTAAMLAGFALATRLEPSVLRATATAGLAAWAAIEGHRQGGVRLLALAVTGLVLVDPFLVYSVGFQLSVAASAGILVLGPPLAHRLPGPTSVADALAVTLSAQAAVLPLLLGYFGPVSMAAVPANLAAGWAAGVVMTWGLSIGLVAGVAPPAVGRWLQWPAMALLRWLGGVAAWAARLPLPRVNATLAVVGVVGVMVAMVVRRAGRSPGPVAAIALALMAGLAVVTVPHAPTRMTALAGDGLWLPAADDRPSLLVVGTKPDNRLLDDLLARRITAVDVVVASSGGRATADLVRSLRQMVGVGAVLAPPHHRITGARTVPGPLNIATGPGTLEVVVADDHLLASLVDP